MLTALSDMVVTCLRYNFTVKVELCPKDNEVKYHCLGELLWEVCVLGLMFLFSLYG